MNNPFTNPFKYKGPLDPDIATKADVNQAARWSRTIFIILVGLFFGVLCMPALFVLGSIHLWPWILGFSLLTLIAGELMLRNAVRSFEK